MTATIPARQTSTARVLRQVPGETAAIAGLVRCLVAAGDLPEARELVDGLDDDTLKDADVEGAISALSACRTGRRGR